VSGTYIAIGSGTGVVVVDRCSHSATDPDCWSTGDVIPGYTVWSDEFVITRAQSDTSGLLNTATVMDRNYPTTGGNYQAVEACYNLTEGGYYDWYLPAKNQLVDAYNNNITGFQSDIYWSSTEWSGYPELYVWSVLMRPGQGNTSWNYKYIPNHLVRCLR
jgi:hypothetical protein